jgi:RNA polymerase sigma factor (TIGR02999 family)
MTEWPLNSRNVTTDNLGSPSDVTQVLQRVGQGDSHAAEELLPLVYDELRKLAAHRMGQEMPGHTLQPTALVHEAWLRLTAPENVRWNGRGHFFGAAAEAMRRILVEKARRKRAQRHGGGLAKIDLDELEIASPAKEDELLELNDVLEQFARRDERKAELVKLRYFVGLPTADRWWSYSRAWLFQEMERRRRPNS